MEQDRFRSLPLPPPVAMTAAAPLPIAVIPGRGPPQHAAATTARAADEQKRLALRETAGTLLNALQGRMLSGFPSTIKQSGCLIHGTRTNANPASYWR